MRPLELALLCGLVILLCCLVAGCHSGIAADPSASRADDAAQWQGTWKLVACTWNGEPQPGDVQWIVSGDRYNIRIDGTLWADPYTFTLDAGQQRIDVFHHNTPEGTFGGKLKGIYDLQGDKLKVCYDLTGQRYPQSFDASPGSRQAVYQFQRERR